MPLGLRGSHRLCLQELSRAEEDFWRSLTAGRRCPWRPLLSSKPKHHHSSSTAAEPQRSHTVLDSGEPLMLRNSGFPLKRLKRRPLMSKHKAPCFSIVLTMYGHIPMNCFTGFTVDLGGGIPTHCGEFTMHTRVASSAAAVPAWA